MAGVPARIIVTDDLRRSRLTVFFRLLLAIPHLVWLALWTVGACLAAIGNWFATLATGRSPELLYRFLAAYVRYSTHVSAFLFLAANPFPGFTGAAGSYPIDVEIAPRAPQHRLKTLFRLVLAVPALLLVGVLGAQPAHPVRLRVDDDLRRSRVTVFFRLLLFVPHYIWLLLWGIAVLLAVIGNWFVTLALGRSPRAVHAFISAYVRYQTHAYAFLGLVGDPFPGFLGRPGSYPIDVEIDGPQRQHRLKTLFRIFLVIPALLVDYSLSVVLAIAAFLGWFAALGTGRMPTGFRNVGAWALRYSAQTNAYLYLLTDRYPYSGPEAAADEDEVEETSAHLAA